MQTRLLLGSAFSWGIALLITLCCRPESAVKTAIAGVGLFVVMLWLSLRRCSTPALPAFRGLLLITAYMTIGMGSFSLLFVIPAVVFATIAIIAIGLVISFGTIPLTPESSSGTSWSSIGSIGCTSKNCGSGHVTVTGVVKSP